MLFPGEGTQVFLVGGSGQESSLVCALLISLTYSQSYLKSGGDEKRAFEVVSYILGVGPYCATKW